LFSKVTPDFSAGINSKRVGSFVGFWQENRRIENKRIENESCKIISPLEKLCFRIKIKKLRSEE
jgi:hypothetical protein